MGNCNLNIHLWSWKVRLMYWPTELCHSLRAKCFLQHIAQIFKELCRTGENFNVWLAKAGEKMHQIWMSWSHWFLSPAPFFSALGIPINCPSEKKCFSYFLHQLWLTSLGGFLLLGSSVSAVFVPEVKLSYYVPCIDCWLLQPYVLVIRTKITFAWVKVVCSLTS